MLREAHGHLEKPEQKCHKGVAQEDTGMGSAGEDIASSRGASQGPKGKEAGMWKLGGIGETCRNGAPGKRD